MSRSTARISDQLGRDPETFPTLNANYADELVLEDGATKLTTRTLGNAWIVGSSTNGIVGPNTNTQGGGQQVVGGNGRVDELVAVVNPDNQFKELFEFEEFKDNSTTTATWSGNGELVFTTGQIALSEVIAFNNATISRATLVSDNTTDMTFELSANNGVDWETVTSGTEHIFTNTGQKLKFKITCSSSQTITKLIISYA